MDTYNVYAIGHHPVEDSADFPVRIIIVVATSVENALKKFREKYPTTRIEEDIEKIFESGIEEVIQ